MRARHGFIALTLLALFGGVVRAEDQLNIDAGPFRTVYIPFAGVFTITRDGRPFLDGGKLTYHPDDKTKSELSGAAKQSTTSVKGTHTVNLTIKSLDDQEFPMQIVYTEDPASIYLGTSVPDQGDITFEGSLPAGKEAVETSFPSGEGASPGLYDPATGIACILSGAPAKLNRAHGTWDFVSTASPKGLKITQRKAAAPALEGVPGFRRPLPGVATGGQPTEAALQAAGKAGYQSVVNLRPDGEEGALANEGEVVGKLGMKYVSLPVTKDDLSVDQAKKLMEILSAPGAGPALVHSGTSNRVGALIALHAGKCEGKPVEEALRIGKLAGLESDLMVEIVKKALEAK